MKANILPELRKTVVKVLSCQFFLDDYIPITDLATMKHFTKTFKWSRYIHEVISMSSETVVAKKIEFKKILSDRIDTFENNLINYQSEVEEFQTLGDINEIEKYVKKSERLDNKLTEALKTITEFNKEEVFFNMAESVYPLWKTVNMSVTNPYYSQMHK
jgi:dynein heavy chain